MTQMPMIGLSRFLRGWVSSLTHLVATGEPHEMARKFRLDRFATGHLLDKEGTWSHKLH